MLDLATLTILILFGMAVFMVGYGWSIQDSGTFFIGFVMFVACVGLLLLTMSGTSSINIPYISSFIGGS
jgi:hypothetical protein